MRIEYDEILKRANERHEKLVALSQLLNVTDTMIANLELIHAWATDVRGVYQSLDEEGRGLIPVRIRQALDNISTTTLHLDRALDDPASRTGDVSTGIAYWTEQ